MRAGGRVASSPSLHPSSPPEASCQLGEKGRDEVSSGAAFVGCHMPPSAVRTNWRQWWPRKSDTIRALASTCHVARESLVDRQSGVELRDTCNGKPYISGMCGRCFRSIWKSDMSPAPRYNSDELIR